MKKRICLTILEHEQILIENERNLDKKILSKQDRDLLLNLTFIDEKKERKNVFTQRGHNVIANSYVGNIVLKNNLIIEILPKFSYDNTKHDIYRNNFINMLKISKRYKSLFNDTKLDSLKNESIPIIDYILEYYSKNLLSLLRQSIYRNYQNKQDLTNILKGKILIEKSLTNINKTKMYCDYNKISENNLLMQIFKTICFILLKYNNLSKKTKNNLIEIDIILQDVQIINLKKDDFDKIVFNRLNLIFKNSFDMSKKIFDGMTPFFQKDKDISLSFLFDMDYVFEDFIYYLLKNKNINVERQKQIDVFKNHISGNTKSVKPDLIIKDNDQNIIYVLDTKWKKSLDTSDFWQMFSYMNLLNKNKEIPGIIVSPKLEKNDYNKQIFNPINNKHSEHITIQYIEFEDCIKNVIKNLEINSNLEFEFKKINEETIIENINEEIILKKEQITEYEFNSLNEYINNKKINNYFIVSFLGKNETTKDNQIKIFENFFLNKYSNLINQKHKKPLLSIVNYFNNNKQNIIKE